MDSQVADVTLHIDQDISDEQHNKLLDAFHQREGVVDIQSNPEKRHLLVIKYHPEQINSRDLVNIPRYQGLRAELIGF